MSRTAAAVDLQPIDRLEEKVRQLVAMIDTLRADRAKALDEVGRLERELDAVLDDPRTSAIAASSQKQASVGTA